MIPGGGGPVSGIPPRGGGGPLVPLPSLSPAPLSPSPGCLDPMGSKAVGSAPGEGGSAAGCPSLGAVGYLPTPCLSGGLGLGTPGFGVAPWGSPSGLGGTPLGSPPFGLGGTSGGSRSPGSGTAPVVGKEPLHRNGGTEGPPDGRQPSYGNNVDVDTNDTDDVGLRAGGMLALQARADPGMVGLGSHSKRLGVDAATGAAGHSRAKRARKQKHVTIFETVNATSWKGLESHLSQTRASIVMSQEHKLISAEQIAKASARAKKLGWGSTWVPAVHGAGGGASAGVVILWRHGLDLWVPPGQSGTLVAGRLGFTFFRSRVLGLCCLYSAYYKDGLGLKAFNLSLVKRMVEHAEEHGLPLIAGGDFNCHPQEWSAVQLHHAGLVVSADPTDASFVSSKASSTLDYFVLSGCLRNALTQAVTILSSPIKQHRPVSTQTLSDPGANDHPTLPSYPRVPTELPVGPRREPLDWTPELLGIQQVLDSLGLGGDQPRSLAGDDRDKGRAALTRFYEGFAHKVDREIKSQMDLPPRGLNSSRGKFWGP